MIFAFVSCEEAHVHDFSTVKFSETEHWKECSCGEKADIEGHIVDKEGNCIKCDATELKAAKVGDTEYTTLVEAIENAQSGSTIILLFDALGDGIGSKDGNKTKDNLIIDFNNHTYTMQDPAVGSTGTETQAMHWGKSLGTITLENGTFKVAENTKNVKMAMQNYIDFNAENMIFDFTNVPVVEYGTDEFTGANAIYNGKEVPLFNNNSGLMTLNDSTLKMPEDSNYGVSADGDGIVLNNTDIIGYVNLTDENSKLTVTGNSEITDVVSYFGELKVLKTEKDGVREYKLVAPSDN